jgi:DnaJ-class molecular chaperone
MVKDTTLYERLNVKTDCCEDEINKAFKLLARKYHPDKHTEENKVEMTNKFQEILQAKEVLLDKEKRDMYDQVGMGMFKGNMDQQQPDVHSFFQQFHQFHPFGNQGFGQAGTNEQLEHITKKLDVTLEQLYNEETITVAYKYKCSCVKCNGEGTKNGQPCICSGCNGQGRTIQVIRMGPMIQQVQTPCEKCRGRGKIQEDNNKCEVCSGKTYTVKEKTIQIPLKSGLTTGNKIELSNKGHQLKNTRTHLILVINELPHQLFKRVNNDLIINVELKLYQALFGFEKMIEHLDGSKVYFSTTSKTDYNKIMRINGKGMKSINTNSSGNLYIRFTVNIPNIQMQPEMKHQCKTLLQSLDKTEVAVESALPKDKVISSLIECREKESFTVMQILNQIMNKDSNDDTPPDNQHQQSCVHQ